MDFDILICDLILYYFVLICVSVKKIQLSLSNTLKAEIILMDLQLENQ